MRRMHNQRQSRDEGFTVLEILVTLAIILLLAAFALPRLMTALNDSRTSASTADHRTIALALGRYELENEQYPTGDAQQVMRALRGRYLKGLVTFRNGYDQSYLYVSSETGQGFVLVDLQGETYEVGEQIQVRCENPSDPSDTTTVTWLVAKGETASLQVGTPAPQDDQIDKCFLVTPSDKIKLLTD